MSRRRQPRKPPDSKAPGDGTPLGHLSDAELFAEMGRRLATRGARTLEDIELAAEELAHHMSEDVQAQTIAALPPEDGTPKPCPRCGNPMPVKARNRVRNFRTVAGELRLVRNYHYCKACKHGFYPRDAELKLPEEGEVSDAMEKRILDFGVNTTFQEAAQRWAIHYPFPISDNLVRRVVDRVGRRCEKAFSPLVQQQAAQPSPEQPAKVLVVAGDGSMLLTREEAWKEVKVAVVARAQIRAREIGPPSISVSDPRYVAVLGNNEKFGAALKGALDAELADEVMKIVWLGDGARENWTMAKELCPFATQVLDLMHAIQHGIDFGKVALSEDSGCLRLWEERIRTLILAPSPDALIHELLDCLPLLPDEALGPLDRLIGYYRSNEKRMHYTLFVSQGLPIGSGIVESAHKHVLQVRMKQAGQRWAILKARRMVQLRALYRTAGPRRFHRAVRDGLKVPPTRPHTQLQNAPRRVRRGYSPSRVSPRGRAASN